MTPQLTSQRPSERLDGGTGFARASATVTTEHELRLESPRLLLTANRKKGVRGGNMVSPAVG
jgi:hypothetical protein